MRIFGYSTKKVTEEDENGESQEKRIARFPVLSVFDVAQTDLVDGAADPSIVDDLTGADGHGVVDALSAYLDGEGWTVEHQDLSGGRNGHSDPEGQRVVIGNHLSPEHTAKTMIHETAHVLMGHVDDLAGYAERRGLMETEAESVAYVVAGLVGFDTSAYSVGYVAGWAEADVELIRGTAARVLATAHQIAAILDPEDEDTDEADAA